MQIQKKLEEKGFALGCGLPRVLLCKERVATAEDCQARMYHSAQKNSAAHDCQESSKGMKSQDMSPIM